MFCIVLGSWVLLGYLTGDFVYTAPNEQKQSQSENIGLEKAYTTWPHKWYHD